MPGAGSNLKDYLITHKAQPASIAGDGVLDVVEQRVDPVERGVLHAGTPASSDMTLMSVSLRIGGTKAPEAIADDVAARCNSLLRVTVYLG